MSGSGLPRHFNSTMGFLLGPMSLGSPTNFGRDGRLLTLMTKELEGALIEPLPKLATLTRARISNVPLGVGPEEL